MVRRRHGAHLPLAYAASSARGCAAACSAVPRREAASRFAWERGARWALVSVFAAHNIEEIGLAGPQGPVDPALMARARLDPGLYRADRFALATALLTVTVGAAVAPTGRQRPSRLRAAVVVAAASALGLNGAVHLGRALATGSPNPGVFSSPAMVAAAASAAVGVCGASGLERRPAVVAGVVGAACSVPAIALSLGVARVVLPGDAPRPFRARTGEA